jgi:hypothetical protein
MSGYADRVAENTATTGTGSLTLAGAIDQTYQTWASAFAVGQIVYYAIYGPAGWEVGRGTLSASTTLTRDSVFASSNAGALVSLTGNSVVFVTHAAFQVADKGVAAAMSMHLLRK